MMHLLHLRPLMLIVSISLTCAWIGLWYGALRLCAYGFSTKNKSPSENKTKTPSELWMIYPHFALLITLPGMLLLAFIPDILKGMGVLSSGEETMLHSLLGDFFYAGILFTIIPFMIKAILLLFKDDEKSGVTAEAINPFSERLNADETILWFGKPKQPYFWKKALKPWGYSLSFLSLLEVIDTIYLTPLLRKHGFYDVVMFILMISVPFIAFVIYHINKKDYSEDKHYYAVTNQRLLVANVVRKDGYNRTCLLYEALDLSKSAKLTIVRGIETLTYKAAPGTALHRMEKGYIANINMNVVFQCIEDADSVDTLIRDACARYLQRQPSDPRPR